MRLDGRVALVTGAGRGIGRAIAIRLASAGAGVVAVARSRDELSSLCGEIGASGGRCHAICADLTDHREPDRIVAEAAGSLGRLDLLVNNAGIAWFKPADNISYEEWRGLMALNVDAVFLLTRACLPLFKAQGSGQIVNIGSDASLKGIGNMSCYCASKFALRGFTMALREELKGSGIRVNLILPGPVNTTIVGPANHPELIGPEDVAELVWQVAALPARAEVWEILLEPRG